jgi:hypothetical protein
MTTPPVRFAGKDFIVRVIMPKIKLSPSTKEGVIKAMRIHGVTGPITDKDIAKFLKKHSGIEVNPIGIPQRPQLPALRKKDPEPKKPREERTPPPAQALPAKAPVPAPPVVIDPTVAFLKATQRRMEAKEVLKEDIRAKLYEMRTEQLGNPAVVEEIDGYILADAERHMSHFAGSPPTGIGPVVPEIAKRDNLSAAHQRLCLTIRRTLQLEELTQVTGPLTTDHQQRLGNLLISFEDLTKGQKRKLTELFDKQIQLVEPPTLDTLATQARALQPNSQWDEPMGEAFLRFSIGLDRYLSTHKPKQLTHAQSTTLKSLQPLAKKGIPDLADKLRGSYTTGILAQDVRSLKSSKQPLSTEQTQELTTLFPSTVDENHQAPLTRILQLHTRYALPAAKAVSKSHQLDAFRQIAGNTIDLAHLAAAKNINVPKLAPLATRLGVFSQSIEGYKTRTDHHRNDVFYKLQPRSGSPLEEMTVGTYNVRILDVPSRSKYRHAVKQQLRDSKEPRKQVIERLKAYYQNENVRMQQLGKIIQGTRTNVIVLQEVLGFPNLVTFMRKTGLDKLYPNVVYMENNGQEKSSFGFSFGTAILADSRVGIPESSIRALTTPGKPRPVVEVDVDTGTGQLTTLMGAHFRRGEDGSHTEESATIGKRVTQLGNKPILALGDFNDSELEIPGLTRQASNATPIVKGPAIDFQYSAGLQFVTPPYVYVDPDLQMKQISDHLPIISKVKSPHPVV